ncbi:MAG: HlyD family type I secretion periplasmic adaptor subunit [Hyphomicrobiaceae bacterium]|nr:HlyD family type I secretion periplasmic adaptor subunit [Hyphomicrobiaceae bacterium]
MTERLPHPTAANNSSPLAGAGTTPYVAGAGLVTVLLICGIGLWSAATDIAGAVIAPGLVVVDGHVKKVQHPTGGIVAAIMVENGDRVQAGTPLVRLDETVTRANLQVIAKQMDELSIRGARLAAERDDASALTLSAALAERLSDRVVAAAVAGEQSLFSSRRRSNEAVESQLRERIEQFDQEAAALDSQRAAKALEIDLIDEQIVSLAGLEEQKLVTATKMIALRREAARLKGEQATLLSSAAQTRGKIAEIELTILQRQQEFRTEVVKELRETEARLTELSERRIAAEDLLARVLIRAPVAGTVHQLAANTVGGVISASDPIMLIVPESQPLVVEAQVSPRDRDQVAGGAPAYIRFASFNQRTTPEIAGTVDRIAADLTTDARTGMSYFGVRVVIPETELGKLGGPLVPGIPADVQITTGYRSALSYLVKPLQDQIARAFRER